MQNIFDLQFTFEQRVKDEVILKFSAKQGGAFYIFSQYWQCFAWAAIIGFIRDERLPLQSPKADKIFSLKTMQCNNGERVAQALICLCIAKAGTLDIMKNPASAIEMINEYANGGFYHIMKLMENGENSFNDLEKVKQEIFSRDFNEDNIQEITTHCIPPSILLNQEQENTNISVESNQEGVQTLISGRWKSSEKKDLIEWYKKGLTIEKLAEYFNKTEESTIECLKSLGIDL